ncbi:hypothetical protein AB8Q18_00480 [Neisseriaceae bacterium CLB008]
MFFIEQDVMGRVPKYEISESFFNNLRKLNETLSDGLSIEQSYDIVISNIIELEKELMLIAIERMYRREGSYGDFHDLIARITLKISNLLSSVKTYIDQLPRLLGNVGMQVEIKQLLTEQYDQNIGYRFMYHFRNHVQHYGLSLGISTGSGWDRLHEKCLYTINPFVTKVTLNQNAKFKQSILIELPERIDLKLMFRLYFEALGAIHKKVRGLLEPLLHTAKETISVEIEKYKKLCGEDVVPIGLYANKYNGENEIVDKILLDLLWDEVRGDLTSKNSILINNSKRYASNEIVKF